MSRTFKDNDRMMHEPPKARLSSGRCGPTGKVRFDTMRAAMDRAQEILSGPSPRAAGLRAYQCGICGGYHLTHKDKL